MNHRIESFGTDDSRMAGWRAVHAEVGNRAPDDSLLAGWTCWLALRDGRPVARLATGSAMDMTGAPGRSGLIGWYEATDAAAGVALLRGAREGLAEAGAARVLGPIHGSTWARYRLALPPAPGDPTPERAFLTEPQNPPEYPAHFGAAGFKPVLEYESRIVSHPRPDPARGEAAERLRAAGITIRPLDPSAWDAELRAIYDLSLSAFAANPFYTPISFSDFRAMYERARPLLDPALVRLAHNGAGELIGFVFAFADPLATKDAARIVLKTLATAPAARGLGLGGFLTDEVHRGAAERGAATIHALMQRSNISVRISSSRESRLFRRYALFGA